MEASPHIFSDLTCIFIAAVAGAFFARRLQLPLILGFVAGGMVISPFTPGPKIHDTATFEELAEVGVVLLMFSIGIEFSFKELMRVKWIAIFGGLLGISTSIALALAVGRLAGWPTVESIVIGPPSPSAARWYSPGFFPSAARSTRAMGRS
jgi:monovalent cation:H+ antiporter-2, CPA2 family